MAVLLIAILDFYCSIRKRQITWRMNMSCCCHKQSFWRRVLGTIAEAIDDTNREHARAKQFKEDTLEKYKGTRVVTIALRSYTNFWGGKKQKDFWYAWDKEGILEFAEREWKNDPNSWGPMYGLIGLLQRFSFPFLGAANGLHQLAYFLAERNLIPEEWNSMNVQMWRYNVIHKMERNWNMTPFRPDSK